MNCWTVSKNICFHVEFTEQVLLKSVTGFGKFRWWLQFWQESAIKHSCLCGTWQTAHKALIVELVLKMAQLLPMSSTSSFKLYCHILRYVPQAGKLLGRISWSEWFVCFGGNKQTNKPDYLIPHTLAKCTPVGRKKLIPY